MVNEQKSINIDCINGDRISLIDVNGSQIPFGKASITFGANYTASGVYHSTMEENRKVDNSVRYPIGRTNNKIITKDQVYPAESTASKNRKVPLISSNRWSYSNDDVIEQKANDTNHFHGDGILSIPVYGSKYPSGEITISVGNKNTTNGSILQTNIRSKHNNTSKNIAEKHDTSHQLIRITHRNKAILYQRAPMDNNHITNIDNKINTQKNNNKPHISSKINRYINSSNTMSPNGKSIRQIEGVVQHTQN